VRWRSAAAWSGRLSFALVRPLWDAQVDVLASNLLTQAPQRDYVAQLGRPLAIEAGAGAIWGALGACRRAGRLGASPSLVPALLALTSPEAIKQV